jgi:NADPH:quinone reductase-like Zn-dependent oxidoreductase
MSAAGNVGAYAVQFPRLVRARVIATAAAKDIAYVYGLDADEVIDFRAARFEDGMEPVDAVIDTVVRRRAAQIALRAEARRNFGLVGVEA